MPALALATPDREGLRRELGRRDPVDWVQSRLGEFCWSKQREILRSVRDHRRTAVQSCHNVGKSWVAARIAAWWIETHEPGDAFVVTSAPTAPQVRAILWREIGRAHARGKLVGRTNQTEWWMEMPAGNEEIVAFGRKPADMDTTGFQGIHQRYVLVILDEACGIPEPLWEAADTLISNDDSKMLAIGNPDDPATEFKRVCEPGSGWNSIKVSAFDSPNFTGEEVPDTIKHQLIGPTWVEEKKRKWGEDNPLYISKVTGEFPEVTTGGLIPMKWIREAQDRDMEPGEPNELGVDVGGGGDRSVIAHRRGPWVRIIRRDNNPDTMQTCGNVIDSLRQTGASRAKVDEIGIGKGVVDRAQELSEPVEGINVGSKARDTEAFSNLRAEAYWGLRERFQQGDIDIDSDDDDLAAQLVDLRYKRTSSGKIQIESKEEMRRRGKPSPDEGDAVMLAFLPPREPTKVSLTWGRRSRRR